MKHKIAALDADKNQLFITIRLDDECHNGHAADEGDEAVAPAGAARACVAPADVPLIGQVHGVGMLTGRCAAALAPPG